MLEAAFRDAAAPQAAGLSSADRGKDVLTIFWQTRRIETSISALSVASSELLEKLSTTDGDDDARIRKAFNIAHVRSLIFRGVQLRDAAKKFLVQVLVKSDCLAISDEDVCIADAGAMGQVLSKHQAIILYQQRLH